MARGHFSFKTNAGNNTLRPLKRLLDELFSDTRHLVNQANAINFNQIPKRAQECAQNQSHIHGKTDVFVFLRCFEFAIHACIKRARQIDLTRMARPPIPLHPAAERWLLQR